MSFKYGKPKKNKRKNREPDSSHDPDEEDYGNLDYGSNQENVKKLKRFNLRKALRNPDSIFENFVEKPKKKSKVLKEISQREYEDFGTGSRTAYSDEETSAGVDDGRPDTLEETISNAIMDGWEETLTSVIREHLPDYAEELLDNRGWSDLGHWDEPMLELAMQIRDNMMMATEEDDRDYEFSRGFEESNRSSNRAEIDE